MKTKYIATGLRTATASDIAKETQRLQKKGYKVKHKTHKKDGSKLAFNGVLIGSKPYVKN